MNLDKFNYDNIYVKTVGGRRPLRTFPDSGIVVYKVKYFTSQLLLFYKGRNYYYKII